MKTRLTLLLVLLVSFFPVESLASSVMDGDELYLGKISLYKLIKKDIKFKDGVSRMVPLEPSMSVNYIRLAMGKRRSIPL